jgi:hypothetical protein
MNPRSGKNASKNLIKRMVRFSVVRVTFTINNTSLASLVILLIHGQADVTTIRFFSASPPDLGEFPRESEALFMKSLSS